MSSATTRPTTPISNWSTGTSDAAGSDLLPQRREVNHMQKFFARLRREEGQTMAEYGVVLAVITVAIVGVLAFLSTGIQAALQSVIDAIS